MTCRSLLSSGLLAGTLLLGACAGAAPPAEPADTPSAAEPTTTSAPAAEPTPELTEPTQESAALTGEEIQAWAADAEWSFLSPGVDEPSTLAFTDGAASDDFMRTYEIGVGVEGDANSDGVVDVAIPVTQFDGNGVLELWYVWLGTDGDSQDVARQVEYPIGRTTRCGDTVHAVTAIDGGFSIDETLWLPEDADRDCASGGTGTQVRDITIAEAEGTAFPLQTAPDEAWGGVTPPPEWFAGVP